MSNKKTNYLKQAVILGISFMIFYLLIKVGISFFSKGGYDPMLEDLFLAGKWKRTFLTIGLGGIFYGVFMYFYQKKSNK